MSVVGRKVIEQRLRLPPYCDEALVITPLARDEHGQPSGIDRDSVDLRLGSRFLLPRAHHVGSLSPGEDDSATFYRAVSPVHVPLGDDESECVFVPAHGTVLGATLEYLKLPYDFSGQVLTRSSLARKFITIETAPWIHPLFRGCLTLEIANASSIPIKIRPGDSIAQLILFLIDQPSKPEHGDEIDRYLGPVYPEP